MLRTLILSVALLQIPATSSAETGADAWLRYAALDTGAARRYRDLPPTITLVGDGVVLQTAQQELIRGIQGMLGRKTATGVNRVPAGNAIVLGTLAQLRQSAPQLAPAFAACIADFDGDGFEDLFLAQNFSPTPLGVPRYDAGRGLLLTGDGKGSLSPMSGTRSGLRIYGDQRGAAYADFDADGRLDLVISQNGAATRLFRNRGAAPGLRVRLAGPPANPGGVGAQIRIVYGDRMGPVREVQAGAGYWSQNGAVQIFGLSGTPTAVSVRWPGGVEARAPVPPGAREIRVTR